ncbi:hypothetical protein ISN44_As11g029340 [Arabidopsis suecica]|uniref:Uncharacterized protein n=1 Tax=Arabidopsis suecica TaxID=45249 RepID=A0A8T1ZED0_ARASU|nr:hypothetical protein ISN44_As11g029340 [Arabidopsis suecica]
METPALFFHHGEHASGDLQRPSEIKIHLLFVYGYFCKRGSLMIEEEEEVQELYNEDDSQGIPVPRGNKVFTQSGDKFGPHFRSQSIHASLGALRRLCNIPQEIEFSLPKPNESPEIVPEGYCCAYEVYFKEAGFSLTTNELLGLFRARESTAAAYHSATSLLEQLEGSPSTYKVLDASGGKGSVSRLRLPTDSGGSKPMAWPFGPWELEKRRLDITRELHRLEAHPSDWIELGLQEYGNMPGCIMSIVDLAGQGAELFRNSRPF